MQPSCHSGPGALGWYQPSQGMNAVENLRSLQSHPSLFRKTRARNPDKRILRYAKACRVCYNWQLTDQESHCNEINCPRTTADRHRRSTRGFGRVRTGHYRGAVSATAATCRGLACVASWLSLGSGALALGTRSLRVGTGALAGSARRPSLDFWTLGCGRAELALGTGSLGLSYAVLLR
jgi:hypothetical protein